MTSDQDQTRDEAVTSKGGREARRSETRLRLKEVRKGMGWDLRSAAVLCEITPAWICLVSKMLAFCCFFLLLDDEIK